MWTTRPRYEDNSRGEQNLYRDNVWVGDILGSNGKRRAEEICHCMNTYDDLVKERDELLIITQVASGKSATAKDTQSA